MRPTLKYALAQTLLDIILALAFVGFLALGYTLVAEVAEAGSFQNWLQP